MKRILLSILAVGAFVYSSNAQTTVTQGSVVSSFNHSNTVVIDQKTDNPSYSVTNNSSSSYLAVTQTLDASATGNTINMVQDGAYNYAHQIQSGMNNFAKLTQYNGVVGTSWDDGGKAYIYQAGEGNELVSYQGTASSLAGQAGNHLHASQSGMNGTLHVYQNSDGVGNYADLTQGEATEQNYQDIQQWGSDNYIKTTQVDGLGNYMFLFQNNNDAAATGNSLTADQRGGYGNLISFKQIGSNNSAEIMQNGNNNKAGLSYTDYDQVGTGHKAMLSQTGDENFIHFEQEGKDHDAKVTQSGSFNEVAFDQAGEKNILSINQTLNGSYVYSYQSGTNNTATITQTGGYGGGSGGGGPL